MFTNEPIAHALIGAHERGVLVEVVTDKSSMGDRSSKIDLLIKKGIPVFVFCPKQGAMTGHLMHNKFALFGNNSLNKSLVWTGSFNLTRAAQNTNQENVLILEDQTVFDLYQKQYDVLKSRCASYSVQGHEDVHEQR